MSDYDIFQYLVLAMVFAACCIAALRRAFPALWARLTGQKAADVAKACGGSCCSGGGCDDPTTRRVQFHLPGKP